MDSSQTSDPLDQGNGSQWTGSEPVGEEKDTFSIMVATDNHLGYLEKDPVRGDDSFAAFEEILSLAAESEVDMILLGGDLFHDNKPSRKTMYITIKLLRKYCLGDKPVSLEFLSDPTDNFPEGIKNVNYMDPNLNVGIPVFSIHGNHDDPSGDGNLCALDQLSMTGLVNYFGRSQEIDNVIVKPILLQKGASRLALYGIGNIRDERLHQTFLRRNVKMMRPVEDDDEEPWYNLLVLHQNRVMHGPKSYIPEAFLDDFIDLVIWGHEHECLVDPVYNPQQGFHVSQPGSSVATSLSEGESKEKHVAILKICKGKFNVQKIRLQSVRPFIMSDVTLADHNLNPTDQQKVSNFISKKVRDLVKQAKEDWIAKSGRMSRKRRMYSEASGDEEEAATNASDEHAFEVPKPLVRLRVEYSGGYEIFNPQRFGQEFVDLVANPRDLVHFYRKKTVPTTYNTKTKAEMDDVGTTEKLDTMRVENLVQKYLSAQNLSILPEIQLADAVRIYVEKDEKDAVKDFVATSLSRMQKVMRNKQNIEVEEALLKEINKEKDLQAKKYEYDHPNGGLLDHKQSMRGDGTEMDMDNVADDDAQSEYDEPIEPKRGLASSSRGGGSSTSARGGRTNRDIVAASATGFKSSDRVGQKTVLAVDSHDEDEEEVQQENGIDGDYGGGRQRAAGSTSRGKQQTAHVVLDTDDENEKEYQQPVVEVEEEEEEEEEEGDFLVPKRGTKAKGKAVDKRAAATKAAPKPRATPAKKAVAATATSTADSTSAGGSSSRAGISSSRKTPSQTAGQGGSQAPSRLISSIGNRKKRLM